MLSTVETTAAHLGCEAVGREGYELVTHQLEDRRRIAGDRPSHRVQQS